MRRWLFAIVFLFVWGLTTHGKYSVTGDEPHYLLVAESLVSDHDLDLANNYAEGDGRRFGRPDLMIEGHARRTPKGQLHSVRDIGLPVLLLGPYLIATRVAPLVPADLLQRFRMDAGLFAYSLLGLSMAALSAMSALVFFEAARRTASTATAFISALTLALAPPVLSLSFLIFPEIPAMFVTAVALWIASRRAEELRWRVLIPFMLAIGMMPWLHRKYAPYALALALVVGWTHRTWLRNCSRRRLLVLVGLYIIPQVLLVAFTWYGWGSLVGPLMIERAPFSMAAFRSGVIGLLVDREHGLLVWAPVYLIVPAAWFVTRRTTWTLLLPALILFLLSAAHDQWWGGWSPAARYLVPLAPIAAYVVAGAARHAFIRRVALFLLAIQALITIVLWQRPRLLWPRGTGTNLLFELVGPLNNLQRWLPSLSPPPVSSAAEGHGWLIVMIVLALSAGLAMASNRRTDAKRPIPLQGDSSATG
jgi:hypothetical protein